jgi:hypothetical protein
MYLGYIGLTMKNIGTTTGTTIFHDLPSRENEQETV